MNMTGKIFSFGIYMYVCIWEVPHCHWNGYISNPSVHFSRLRDQTSRGGWHKWVIGGCMLCNARSSNGLDPYVCFSSICHGIESRWVVFIANIQRAGFDIQKVQPNCIYTLRTTLSKSKPMEISTENDFTSHGIRSLPKSKHIPTIVMEWIDVNGSSTLALFQPNNQPLAYWKQTDVRF